MKHLTQKQINEMAYYVLNKEIFTDELVEAKKHMAECESCYEEFCVAVVAAYDLLEKGIIEKKTLLYSEAEQAESCKNTYLKIKCMAGELQIVLSNAIENAVGKLWRFMPVQQLSMARGTNENSEQIFVNSVSEYSSIKLAGNILTVRLDDEYYEDGAYEVVLIVGNREKVFSFTHNELEECLEVIIELESDEYELIIRGISQ